MGHPQRLDADGRYFHVMNRGIARRTVFELPADVRYFLSRLAKAVRREEIEVLAYALIATHFHILVRSRGRLSRAFRRVQTDVVRWFNRSRHRDGPLFRGRFRSKPVRTRAHLRNAFLDILENPIEAGLATIPHAYPWCSASVLERRRPPKWLAVELLERLGLAAAPGRIGALAPKQARRDRAALIEHRMATRGHRDEDGLDDLLGGTITVPAWMRRNAQLADGTLPAQPIAAPDVVRPLVTETVPEECPVPTSRSRTQQARILLTAGLLRDLAAASYADVARTLGRSDSNAKKLIEQHRRCLLRDETYIAVATLIAERCLAVLRQ